MTLDKLSDIKGDLVKTDSEWETWDFEKLAESLTNGRVSWVESRALSRG